MGTIRVNPFTVNETNSWSLLGGAADAPSALSGLGGRVGLTFPPTNSLYELDCEPGTTILIDGVATLFASLPAGFTVLTLNLHISGIVNLPTHFSAFTITYNGSIIYNSTLLTLPKTIAINLTGFTPLDLYNSHFIVDVTPDNIDPTDATLNLDGFYLDGTYELQNFSWDMSNIVQPVQTGSQVTVTSDLTDPDHLQLDQLSAVDVVTTEGTFPVTSFITVEEGLLVFDLPNFTSTPQPQVLEIQATGNGVQFSGSVTLGKLETIYFTNAPGIYKLDPNATSDTLYDTDNGGTIEVAIPDPFFKGGFIGG